MTAMAAQGSRNVSGAMDPAGSTITLLQGFHTVLLKVASQQATLQNTIKIMQATQQGMQTTQQGMQTAQQNMANAIQNIQETQKGIQETQNGFQETQKGIQETQNAQGLGMKDVELRQSREISEATNKLGTIVSSAQLLGFLATLLAGYLALLKQ